MMSHQKKGIHPRPCGIINLSNIISYGRGTLPYLIDAGHYEEIIKCLPLFKDCTVKLIDAMTQNSDNTMLRAYLLEYMKEDKTDFDI